MRVEMETFIESDACLIREENCRADSGIARRPFNYRGQSPSRRRAEAALWRREGGRIGALQDLAKFSTATAIAKRLGLR